MTEGLPEFLKQGEAARLFPVLSTTSKEGRTTSIVLACLSVVRELGSDLLKSIGQNVGVRTKVECYTEIVFRNSTAPHEDRPDGLIVVSNGNRQWRALVEAKIGSATHSVEQIEKYRKLAQEQSVDCVITLSNQFAAQPQTHPLEQVRKSRSRIPVYHWSWMHILTTSDLLLTNEAIADDDQKQVLSELRRFLTHESAGVRGFERMPPEWSELNKLVSSGGSIPAKSPLLLPVILAWHQETRDLSLILSRMTGARVSERLPRKHQKDAACRVNDDSQKLRDEACLESQLMVPDAAAPIEISADLRRRSIDVGMTLRAPDDRKSTSARINWLLRQIKHEQVDDFHVRLQWPGTSGPTQFQLSELRENVQIAEVDKSHLSPNGFHIFLSKRLGGRFTQQSNFISDLEQIVPDFYGSVGSALRQHQKKAPTLRPDRKQSDDVTPEAIHEESDETKENGPGDT
ncbi:hypothetical protein [uncultured Tateyamaria sp.]|uniref:hypothetical protein n=1 Tax=Tateyamaria sp. 1078 TaxID=3417464 RepID=UPI002620952D|nr:hypothetical protein [uncultured Tateyamaria sp.]